MSALGQKQTYALQHAMSALPPIATAKADMPQTVMFALLLKADVWAQTVISALPGKKGRCERPFLSAEMPSVIADVRVPDGAWWNCEPSVSAQKSRPHEYSHERKSRSHAH